MQFLQLMESRHGVFHLGQLLSGLAKSGFDFKVLLEIVSAKFVVQTQLVVELLNIQLVGFPQFRRTFSWHLFDFLPFSLQVLKLIIILVGLIRCCRHFLDALNDGEFSFQSGLLFLFKFLHGLRTHFANAHRLEVFLFGIRSRHKFFHLSAVGQESLSCGKD